MTLLLDSPDLTLYVGDVRDCLAELPDESVHCVVTSPPYWGLRDYGTGSWEGGNPDCDHAEIIGAERTPWANSVPGPAGATAKNAKARNETKERGGECRRCGARRVDQQLGLEPTPEAYVENMVAVFQEVRRVLRRDGTCWLNIGDSYNGVGAQYGGTTSFQEPRAMIGKGTGRHVSGLKPKDLCGIPWRLAFALQADGWYLRSEIIWAKSNPMPESVTDRPTKAHEQVFLLARSPRYFYDADAVREPYQYDGRRVTTVEGRDGSIQHRNGERWPGLRPRRSGNLERKLPEDRDADLGKGQQAASIPWEEDGRGRNLRSVWEIATQPYSEAHFATYPEELVRRCVLAGTSERGCCPECGAPWEREVERHGGPDPSKRPHTPKDAEAWASGVYQGGATTSRLGRRGWQQDPPRTFETLGWRPTCDHDREPIPCTVADPFLGSGTTALVARKHGRRAVGIELRDEYARLALDRNRQLTIYA